MAYKGNECKHDDCQYKMPLRPDAKAKFCGYLLITKHSRGCEVKDCTHYKDKVERERENLYFGQIFDDGTKYEWVSAQLKAGGMR